MNAFLDSYVHAQLKALGTLVIFGFVMTTRVHVSKRSKEMANILFFSFFFLYFYYFDNFIYTTNTYTTYNTYITDIAYYCHYLRYSNTHVTIFFLFHSVLQYNTLQYCFFHLQCNTYKTCLQYLQLCPYSSITLRYLQCSTIIQ